MSNLMENLVLENVENKTNQYIQQHEKLFEAIEAESPNFLASGRAFTTRDAYNLGSQIERYKTYEAHMTEQASASDLGPLPKFATDLIASIYAISPAPLLASIQTIPDQQGIVYFKKVAASGMISRFPYTTESDPSWGGTGFGPQGRGGLLPGDDTVDARRGWVGDTSEYASEQVAGEELDPATWKTQQVKMYPVRGNIPVRIVATVGTNVYEGTFINREGGHSDVGTLMTADGWASGTIRYSTGQLDIVSGENPDNITISYMQDFETAADIPVIEMTMSSMQVMAEVLAIKMNISALKSYQLNQRFGRSADQDALMDLAGHMADVEGRRIVKGYTQMANWIERQGFSGGRPIEFDLRNPTTQSRYEYLQGFRYALVSADAEINLNSGRGAANRYIAGHKACEIISALPGFEAAPANLAVGPHVFGYYQGKPVIRTSYIRGLLAPENGEGTYTGGMVDATNAVIAAYLNPQSPFDAPMVEATYMPVFMTNTMQIGYNPLQNARAIASWKAFQSVVPHYTKAISLYMSPNP